MFQIRLYGSGGEDILCAAQILSIAARYEGHCARVFPPFEAARLGAPAVAFCRIAESETRLRGPVMEADAIIVQDEMVLRGELDLFGGMRPRGYVLVNSTRSIVDLGWGDLRLVFPAGHVRTIPATELAQARPGQPVPAGAVLLGSFAALTGELEFDSIAEALRRTFPRGIAEATVCAARAGFEAIAGRAVTASAGYDPRSRLAFGSRTLRAAARP